MSKGILLGYNRYIKSDYFSMVLRRIFYIISYIVTILFFIGFNNNNLLASNFILQGNSIKYEDYLNITKDMTKLQVEELLGVTVIKNYFNNDWIYVRIEKEGSKIKEDLLVISFNDLQRVESVKWISYCDDEIVFQNKK